MRTLPQQSWMIAAAVTLSLSLPAAADGPATRPATTQQQDLESLIAALSSDNGAARQHAQDRLVELGLGSRDVESRLTRLARESRDEEAVARAQAALRIIAEQRLVGPALVTLHLRGAEPRDAFAQLSAQ